MKRIFFIIVFAVCVVAVIAWRLISDKAVRAQLKANDMTGSQLQEEISRVRSERDKAITEVEHLQGNTVTCMTLNGKLQIENEKLALSLAEAQKASKNAEESLEKERDKIKVFERAALKREQGTKADARLIDQTKKELLLVWKKLKREQQACHYNLGVAYTRARLYREAAEEYEKALALDPGNKEAHYNLGLLYDKVQGDAQKALVHYRAFMELAPQGQDKREVQGWIDRLAK
jgi:tetratricopeptide (TPR) repeat protein